MSEEEEAAAAGGQGRKDGPNRDRPGSSSSSRRRSRGGPCALPSSNVSAAFSGGNLGQTRAGPPRGPEGVQGVPGGKDGAGGGGSGGGREVGGQERKREGERAVVFGRSGQLRGCRSGSCSSRGVSWEARPGARGWLLWSAGEGESLRPPLLSFAAEPGVL